MKIVICENTTLCNFRRFTRDYNIPRNLHVCEHSIVHKYDKDCKLPCEQCTDTVCIEVPYE